MLVAVGPVVNAYVGIVLSVKGDRWPVVFRDAVTVPCYKPCSVKGKAGTDALEPFGA